MAEGENSKIYAQLNDHDHRITALESTRPFLQDLIARSVKSNEELATTMKDVQLSMVKLNDKLDKQADEIKSIKEDSEKSNKDVSTKLTTVENKISALEDAGKFDIRGYLKHNFPWIIVILGMGALYVTQYVKF